MITTRFEVPIDIKNHTDFLGAKIVLLENGTASQTQ